MTHISFLILLYQTMSYVKSSFKRLPYLQTTQTLTVEATPHSEIFARIYDFQEDGQTTSICSNLLACLKIYFSSSDEFLPYRSPFISSIFTLFKRRILLNLLDTQYVVLNPDAFSGNGLA
jgi:hypothetical protein